jgi:pimeloyl-ACP methyl ester carboxylesterase
MCKYANDKKHDGPIKSAHLPICKFAYLPILLIGLLLMLSGCFSRFVMTEKEIKEFYKDKKYKPTYFTIKNDSVELFCATSGADTLPPLLIIHGAPGAWYGSRNFLDDSTLNANYHIISVDRPGYNKSKFKNKKSAVTSIDIQATAIYEAMRLNRSFKTGVIMGSSYGGPIAAKIAVNHPDRFHHLVLLAAAMDPEKEKFWWFNQYVSSGIIRWFLPRFINSATDEKYSHVKELNKMLPDWEKLNLQITLVQGGADNIVDPANLDFARKHLQGKKAEFIFIPDAGHLIRFNNEPLVKSILGKSLNEVRELPTGGQ